MNASPLPPPDLVISTLDGRHGGRRGEPVTMGVPCPKGWCHDTGAIGLTTGTGEAIPVQVRVLDRWSDESLRWILIHFQADAAPDTPVRATLQRNAVPVAVTRAVDVRETADGIAVDTGMARFAVARDGVLAQTEAVSGRSLSATGVLAIADGRGERVPLRPGRVVVEERGPLRAVVLVEAMVRAAGASLHVFVRYYLHAGSAAVRIQATVRNPRRARHPRGSWDLGDPGSVSLDEVSFQLHVEPAPDAGWRAGCSPAGEDPFERHPLPFELYQDSSGGENWQSANHLNRHRVVPLRFRGYRLRSGSEERTGLRATPVVTLEDASGRTRLAVAQQRFWERFPKAVATSSSGLTLGLLPAQSADVHELQGGEQVSEEFVVCFGPDSVSELSLDWVRHPLVGRATPEWYCAADAMPWLTPRARSASEPYEALVAQAIDGPGRLEAKRERIDEYGWRHFGDLYADHEAVFHHGPHPLISHYNNQYDAVAGFACQFFRSGDLRWFTVLDDLARHVVDIDVYHTDEDRAAYNHGLFWHTAHHVDADLATHRTYPRTMQPAGGGPSPEHNYNTGLMLYYYLTGDPRARDAAVGLGEWVIALDDGSRTPFRWLSRRPTGVASCTGSPTYHGPGRAPGNSIVALLNAHRLTGEARFMTKAGELIRRCIHPADDVAAHDLLDAERRWYYTVFLQALGRYLQTKSERGELDAMYAYARAALLHYARWMVRHEYPYLEKPEILEFPNETWAAQDMRKCEVLTLAARYSDGDERARFLDRAAFFFEVSVSTLARMETRTFTRPVVLMLTNGYAHLHVLAHGIGAGAPLPGEPLVAPRPVRFVPQKAAAVRHAVYLGLAGGALLGWIAWVL